MTDNVEPFARLNLLPTYMRPRWCRNSEQAKWWLPWDSHAILTTLNTHHEQQTGAQIFTHAGLGPGHGYLALYQLEELKLVESAWEDERFPEAWSAKGHYDDCGCPRGRYYRITAQGKLCLEKIPLRPRPPRWRRPGFLVALGLWIACCVSVGFFIF